MKEVDWTIRHCPECGGSGKNCDAALSIGPGVQSKFTPASDCTLCNGKGLVHVTPLTDAELVEHKRA